MKDVIFNLPKVPTSLTSPTFFGNFGIPIVTDDGTVLTDTGAFEDDGKTFNSAKSLPYSSGRYLWGSYNYRDGTTETLYSIYSTGVTDANTYLVYSTDQGATWSSGTVSLITYARGVIRVGSYVYVVKSNATGNDQYIVKLPSDLSTSTTYTYSSANSTSFIYLSNLIHARISGTDFLVFSTGEYILGYNMVSNGFVGLTSIVSTYSVKSNHSQWKMCNLIGKFPYIYAIWAATPGSTTNYLYKLTDYGTSTNSWDWESCKTLPDEVICSESLDDHTFIAETDGTSKRVWKLNHYSGKSYLVYTSDYTIKLLGATQKQNCPFLIVLDDSTYKYVYFDNYTDELDVCESYHFINANITSCDISINKKSVIDVIDNINNAVIDIYQYYEKINPAYYSLYEETTGSNPSITGITYSNFDTVALLSEYYNHAQILHFYEDIATTTTPTGIVSINVATTGEADFTYGTIGFLIGGYTDNYSQPETAYPWYIQLLEDDAGVAMTIDVVFTPYGFKIGDNTSYAYFNRSLHLAEIHFEFTTGGYKGLSQYQYSLYVDGIEVFSGEATGTHTDIRYIKVGGAANVTGATLSHMYFGSVLSTYFGDHPLRNFNKGNLTYRGFLDGFDQELTYITIKSVGLDAELSSNSNIIEQASRTNKVVLETLVDNMYRIYHQDSIDPHGEFTTEYNLRYDSKDYYSLIDNINDRENSIEYRDPTGRMWVLGVDWIHNSQLVVSNTSTTNKVFNTKVHGNAGKSVNRVVITGKMYSDASGTIRQSVGVAEDKVSIDMDGIHELVRHIPSCSTPQECKTIADKLLTQAGSAINNPYKLISTQIKMDWIQVGTIINFTDTIENISQGNKNILSMKYDYRMKTAYLDISDGIIQDEDANVENEYKRSQTTVSNEFIEDMSEATINANDQIVYRNSIDALQTGIVNKTPWIINTGDDNKGAFGVIGKDWVENEVLTSRTEFSGTATVTVDTISGMDKAMKIVGTAGQYVDLALGDLSSVAIEVLFYRSSSTYAEFSIALLDSSNNELMYIKNFGKYYTSLDTVGINYITYDLTIDNIKLEFTNGGTEYSRINGYLLAEKSADSANVSKIRFKCVDACTVYVDAIGYSNIGYYSFTNRNGSLSANNIILGNKELGMRFFPIHNTDTDTVSSTGLSGGQAVTLDISSYLPNSAKYAYGVLKIIVSSSSGYKIWVGYGVGVRTIYLDCRTNCPTNTSHIGMFPLKNKKLYIHTATDPILFPLISNVTDIYFSLMGYLSD